MKKIPAVFLISLTAIASSPAHAVDDAFDFFREEAKVYTASRRPESSWRAPMAVDVVTAAEIEAYGHNNLADILRFRAGIDVIDGRSADGNRAIVSARGFTRDFVAEMQVLIDGRSVYSPLLGGVYWTGMPVQIQDIARIEIVRGPNAALYGSNAALGVINIITRKPGTAAAGGVSARGGNRVLASSEFAERGVPLAGLRLSHSYEEAPGNPPPNGVGESNDFFHSHKLNMRARLNPDIATEIEFMSGASWQTLGVPGFPVNTRADNRDEFELLRVVRDLSAAESVEVSVSHSEFNISLDRFFLAPIDVRVYQYDAEILHHLEWGPETIHSVMGASWRLSGTYSDKLFAGRPASKNEIVRGFTHHSAQLTDALTVVAGVSLERSDVGGLQPAGQSAVLYSPRENHAFRISYARAPTIPPLFNKYGNFSLSATTSFLGNSDLAPQQLSSWETGWTHRALEGALKSNITLYYMEIKDRIFQHVQSLGPPRLIVYDSRNRAAARGVELSEEYAFAPGRVIFANYTFEKISDDQGIDAAGTNLRKGTPLHKVNLGGRALLVRGLAASALLGYKDAYDANSTTRGTRRSIGRSFRLDARLSWMPRLDWEFSIAGKDLIQPYRVESSDGTSSPRRYEFGISKRFGL